jgi:hypothetical protein
MSMLTCCCWRLLLLPLPPSLGAAGAATAVRNWGRDEVLKALTWACWDSILSLFAANDCVLLLLLL